MSGVIAWISWLWHVNIPGILIDEVWRLLTGHARIYEIQPGLYQASKISRSDADSLKNLRIEAVIDLEGSVDDLPDFIKPENYKYWPIEDIPELPDLVRLDEVAAWGYGKWKTSGLHIATHCRAGRNRSGLVNGRILVMTGMTGNDAVKLIQKKVPGALSNTVFAGYIRSLP
jgi:hypothetical protein